MPHEVEILKSKRLSKTVHQFHEAFDAFLVPTRHPEATDNTKTQGLDSIWNTDERRNRSALIQPLAVIPTHSIQMPSRVVLSLSSMLCEVRLGSEFVSIELKWGIMTPYINDAAQDLAIDHSGPESLSILWRRAEGFYCSRFHCAGPQCTSCTFLGTNAVDHGWEMY